MIPMYAVFVSMVAVFTGVSIIGFGCRGDGALQKTKLIFSVCVGILLFSVVDMFAGGSSQTDSVLVGGVIAGLALYLCGFHQRPSRPF